MTVRDSVIMLWEYPIVIDSENENMNLMIIKMIYQAIKDKNCVLCGEAFEPIDAIPPIDWMLDSGFHVHKSCIQSIHHSIDGINSI